MSLESYNLVLSTMSDAKIVAKNFVLLYAGELVGQFLSFFLVIAIARYLGDIGLGKYSFAFSFVSIFLILADMGLPTLITKQVAKDKKLAKFHLTSTFTLKLVLNIAAFALTIISIFLVRKDYETIFLVALAALAMFFFNLGGVYRAVFQAYEIMKYEAFLKIVERIVAAGLGIFLLYKGYGILALFAVFILSNAVYYFAIYALAKTKISSVSLSINRDLWKKTIKESMPFWLTLIFLTLYFRIDVVMLTFMKGFQDTGWYTAAVKIIEVITRIPFLLNIAVFPALAKLSSLSRDKTMFLFKKSFYYMVLLALPIATGLFLLADRIVLYAYSSAFSNSAVALQVLAASLIFVFVNYLMGYLLNAIDRQKLFTLAVSVTALLNIVLNLLLIPRYSYIGAAYATLISEIISFALLYYFTMKNDFRIGILSAIAKPAIANIAVIVVVLYFKSLHLAAIAGLAAISYFAVMFLIKGIDKEDIGIVKSLAQRK